MCLFTDQKHPRIALDPITVYKELYLFEYTLVSIIAGWYKWGLRTQTSRLIKRRGGRVKQGFHSYKERPKTQQWHGTNVWVEAVIPKGAKYYENGEEYASDKLRMLNKYWKITNPTRAKKWKKTKKCV